VGIVGSGGFKKEWLECLRPFRVVLALDNDSAGREGAERIARVFGEESVPVGILSLPESVKDVNDFFLHRSAEEFSELLETAGC